MVRFNNDIYNYCYDEHRNVRPIFLVNIERKDVL